MVVVFAYTNVVVVAAVVADDDFAVKVGNKM